MSFPTRRRQQWMAGTQAVSGASFSLCLPALSVTTIDIH